MIVEYIRYTINESRHREFLNSYKEASKQLDNSKYCLSYELSHCEEVMENFILRIEWTSTEDHLQGFRNSSQFVAFFALVKPFYEDIAEMHHYAVTNVVGTKS